jgi:hypothetical protein
MLVREDLDVSSATQHAFPALWDLPNTLYLAAM